MDASFPIYPISIGLNTKQPAFKILEFLGSSEKNIIVKDSLSKPSAKSSIYDPMDYLKSGFLKPKEIEKGSIIDSSNPEDNKKSMKRYKQKLIVSSDMYNDLETIYSIKNLIQLQPGTTFKGKIISLPLKLKKRSYSTIKDDDLHISNILKKPKLQLSLDAEILYVSPDLFYQSTKDLSIDSKEFVFYLFGQDCWFEIRLPCHHIKNVTVFKQQSMIKIGVRNSILMEMQYISVFNKSTMPITLHPKKVSILKDMLIVFTKSPVSSSDLSLLRSILSDDKIIFNSTDKESNELLSNIFHGVAKFRENMSNFSINWSLLSNTIADSSSKKPISSVKKSPVTPSKSTTNVGKLASSTPNQIPSIMHQATPIGSVAVTNGPKPIVNTVLCHTNANYIGNHILIGPPLTPNRIDPYPNLFHRMINDVSSASATMGQLAVMSCPTPNQTNFSIQISHPNQHNGGIFHNPRQLVPNAPQNQHMAPTSDTMHNGTPSMAFNANVMAVAPTNLFYVPGRHIGNIFTSFNYAPSPEYNVLIHGSDLTCLNYGQYLNDNIINFYLNYIRYELCNEEQRQNSHLFNVFFNTKLQGSPTSHLTESPETRHARVAKWTKKVDIFDKDFIIIPINESQHWFLAIVCFPWMAGMISYDTLFGGNNLLQSSEIPVNKSEFATVIREERVRKLREEKNIDPKPCILLFDSLQHLSRAPNVKLIREYLKTEWDIKRKARDGPLVFDKNTIRGFNPKVPQQSNLIDCGIYVLHYVEMFVQKPLSVYTKEYFEKSLAQWFDTQTVELKREHIQKLLLKKGEAQKTQSENNLLSPKLSLDDSGPDIQIL